MTASRLEKLNEVLREIRQRQRVYPRLIAAGKLSQADADRQIAIMREIADDYRYGERLL